MVQPKLVGRLGCSGQRVECAAGGGGDGDRIGGERVSRHCAKCLEGEGREDWRLMLLHHFYSTTRVRPREVLVLRGSNLTGESGFGTICPNIGKE